MVGSWRVEDEETSSAPTHPMPWEQVVYSFLFFFSYVRKSANQTSAAEEGWRVPGMVLTSSTQESVAPLISQGGGGTPVPVPQFL